MTRIIKNFNNFIINENININDKIQLKYDIEDDDGEFTISNKEIGKISRVVKSTEDKGDDKIYVGTFIDTNGIKRQIQLHKNEFNKMSK